MGALLVLGSALFYGIADFAGGPLSRRADATAIALIGQVGALLVTLVIAPFVQSPPEMMQHLSEKLSV